MLRVKGKVYAYNPQGRNMENVYTFNAFNDFITERQAEWFMVVLYFTNTTAMLTMLANINYSYVFISIFTAITRDSMPQYTAIQNGRCTAALSQDAENCI